MNTRTSRYCKSQFGAHKIPLLPQYIFRCAKPPQRRLSEYSKRENDVTAVSIPSKNVRERESNPEGSNNSFDGGAQFRNYIRQCHFSILKIKNVMKAS